jgi:hypothetical protein
VKSRTRRALPALCSAVVLALAVGCGDKEADAGAGTAGKLDKLGSDLKDAGKDVAKDAQAAAGNINDQLKKWSGQLETMAKNTAGAVSMKGDALADTLKARMPEMEKTIQTVKLQLDARGGQLKELGKGLDAKAAEVKTKLDDLAKAGAAAGANARQAAVDAFVALANQLKGAIDKLLAA